MANRPKDAHMDRYPAAAAAVPLSDEQLARIAGGATPKLCESIMNGKVYPR